MKKLVLALMLAGVSASSYAYTLQDFPICSTPGNPVKREICHKAGQTYNAQCVDDGAVLTPHVSNHGDKPAVLVNGQWTCPTSAVTTFTNPCEGGSCTVEGSRDFKLTVKMGGLSHGLKVCGLGFLGHNCYGTECDKKADHMSFTTGGVLKQIQNDGTTGFSETDLLGVSAADVFLNSFHAGSKFFIRYCLDGERNTVGNYHPDLVVNSHALVTPGTVAGLDEYFNTVGLHVTMKRACSGVSSAAALAGLQTFWPSELAQAGITFGDTDAARVDNFCVGTACAQFHCAWEFQFEEKNTCLRPIVKDAQGVLKIKGGQIDTHVDYSISQTCNDGSC